jgi:hypothetical protein
LFLNLALITAMRVILGLDLPTSGTARVRGRRYQEIIRPLHEVGALLDANAVHPGARERTKPGPHAHIIPLISRTATTQDTAVSPSVAVSTTAVPAVRALVMATDLSRTTCTCSIGSCASRIRSLEVLTSISTQLDGLASPYSSCQFHHAYGLVWG